MDLLDLNKLNSKISFVETRKKFFNAYYYNIKYFCPGGRIILNDLNLDLAVISDAINFRQELNRSYNYGGSWRVGKERIKDINPEQLLDMSAVKKHYLDNVRMRIEEPYISLYADDKILYEIAVDKLKKWTHNIISVSRPKTEEAKHFLDAGSILMKTDIGYRYKFVCKEGACPNKNSIYTYLKQLGNQVQVSPAVWNMLSKQTPFTWGIWFYTNDASLANILNIIEPNFVTNIHQVVVT